MRFSIFYISLFRLVLSNNILAKYQFLQGASQIVPDSSGNQKHAIVSSTLGSGDLDITWTQRGAYLLQDQYFLLPPNAISESKIPFSLNFSFQTWVFMNSGQTEFLQINSSQHDLVLFYDFKFSANYQNNNFYDSSLTSFKGDIYTGQWIQVTFTSQASSQVDIKVYVNQALIVTWSSLSFFDFDTVTSMRMMRIMDAEASTMVYQAIAYGQTLLQYEISAGNYLNFASADCTAYPLDANGCLSTCTDHQADNECTPCDCQQDVSCTSTGMCLQCQPGCKYYCIFEPYQCVDVRNTFCSPHPFNTTLQECIWDTQCLQNCYFCYNSTVCQQCQDNYYRVYDWTSCLQQCPDGQYLLEPKICGICHQDCKTCQTGEQNGCLTCNSPDKIILNSPGPCVCQDGQYQDSVDNSSCLPCHSECATCSAGTQFDCLSCTNPVKKVIQGYCECTDGYYLDPSNSSQCLPCHSECATCNSGTQFDCLTCQKQGKILDQNSQCVCDTNWYIDPNDSTNCLKCHYDCASCTAGSQFNCLSCTSAEKTLISNQCLCPDGQYQDPSDTQVCLLCHLDCATCYAGDEDDCYTCKSDEKYLSQNDSCLCPDGEYEDSSDNLSCLPCHIDCATCYQEMQTDCLTCVSSMKVVNATDACVCPDGQYQDQTDEDNCLDCDQNCQTCIGGTSFDCLTCANQQKILDEFNECVCPDGFFIDPNDSNLCLTCHQQCKTCNGPLQTDCKSCVSEQKISDSFYGCVCPEGTFQSYGGQVECEQCSQICATCTGSEGCTSCKYENQYLDENGDCQCEDGYYGFGNECGICHESCETCDWDSEYDCLSCVDPNSQILIWGDCVCKEFHVDIDGVYCECERELIEGVCYGNFTMQVFVNEQNNLEIIFQEPVTVTESDFQLSLLNANYTFSSDLKTQNETFVQIFLDFGQYEIEQGIYMTVSLNRTILSTTEKVLQYKTENLELNQTVDSEDEQTSQEDDFAMFWIDTALTVAATAGIVAGVASSLAFDDPSVLWTIVNTAQIISYIPIFDVNISDRLFQHLLSYQTIDYIPNLFLDTSQSQTEAPDRYKRYGQQYKEFQDSNFIRNSGRIFQVIFIYFCVQLLILMIKEFICCEKLKTKVNNYIYSIRSGLYRLWLELLLDWLVVSVVQLFEYSQDFLVGYILALSILTGACLTILHVPYVVYTYYTVLSQKPQWFMRKYGSLVEEFKCETCFGSIYYSFFCARRIVMAICFYACLQYQYLQLTLNIFMTIGAVWYVNLSRIHNRKSDMMVYLYSQGMLCFDFVILIVIHSEGLPEHKNFIQWAMIIANFSVVLFASIVSVITIIQHFRNRNKKVDYRSDDDGGINDENQGFFGKIIILDEDAQYCEQPSIFGHSGSSVVSNSIDELKF